jgi:hypothetical protein
MAERKTKFHQILKLCAEAECTHTIGEIDACISALLSEIAKGTKYETDINMVLEEREKRIDDLRTGKPYSS